MTNSRRKGHDWERDVVIRLKGAGIEARRKLQYQADHETCDVDADPFWIECKVGQVLNIPAALQQAEDCRPAGRYSVAICKKDRGRPTVTMYFDDWLEIVTQWRANK